jgi:hypothetical protein
VRLAAWPFLSVRRRLVAHSVTSRRPPLKPAARRRRHSSAPLRQPAALADREHADHKEIDELPLRIALGRIANRRNAARTRIARAVDQGADGRPRSAVTFAGWILDMCVAVAIGDGQACAAYRVGGTREVDRRKTWFMVCGPRMVGAWGAGDRRPG